MAAKITAMIGVLRLWCPDCTCLLMAKEENQLTIECENCNQTYAVHLEKV